MEVSWQLIETTGASPEFVMAKDFNLLNQLNTNSKIILHLYEWDGPSLTYGYFIEPAHFLHLDALQTAGIRMGRRPTGGGIIFHLTDFAFSILIPSRYPQFSLNTLENYANVNTYVGKVIAAFSSNRIQPELFNLKSDCKGKECRNFCMAGPTQYDLVVDGKKIGGAAQRRTKQGLLHQGSLSLVPLSEQLLNQILKKGDEVVKSIHDQSGYLLDKSKTSDVQQARSILRELMKKEMNRFCLEKLPLENDERGL